MASGKPVVAMINGEGADVIKDADCGWSVPSGDSAALADYCFHYLQKAWKFWKRKGTTAKNTAEKRKM